MTIPFHPLADLFPLIEGAEFDELVASIKANGLREEITMFDDAILDGRNRYRACGKAGVEPRFHTYTGTDPHQFVVDMNIHRRHLNTSQRAMIAARMATLKVGNPNFGTHESPIVAKATIAPPTIDQSASLLNIGRDSVIRARRILRSGSRDEIEAVEKGNISVRTIADQIKDEVPQAERHIRKEDSPKRQGRIHQQQVNAQIWGQLRDAILNLTDLPHPVEVARIARFSDKGHILDAKLTRALNYLKEFSDAWRSQDNNQSASRSDNKASVVDGDTDAGNGDRASGAERSQQAAE